MSLPLFLRRAFRSSFPLQNRAVDGRNLKKTITRQQGHTSAVYFPPALGCCGPYKQLPPCSVWRSRGTAPAPGTGSHGFQAHYCLMEKIQRSPVEVGPLSHYFQGFIRIPGGCLRFLNHQQYYSNCWE